jgi:hypothetical protein
VHTVVNLRVIVLHLIVVDAMLLVGAVKTLIYTVHVDSPQVVNTLVDLAVVAISAGDCGSNQPEEHVLGLQFEDGYTQFEVR